MSDARAITFERVLLVLNTALLVLGGSVWAMVDGYRLFRQQPFEYRGDLTVKEIKRYDDGSRLYDVSFATTLKNFPSRKSMSPTASQNCMSVTPAAMI